MTAERVIPNFEPEIPPVEFDAPRNGNGTTPLRPRTNSTTTRRVPPHDEATEAALLGAMLTSPDACTAATHLAPTDFFNVAHQHVFTAATGLHAKGEPVEVRTVADALRRDGLFDHVREDRLVGLIAGEYVASSAPTYARIVADHARLRALIAVAAEIADLGYSLPDDVAQVETRAAELVAACAARTPTKETLVSDLQPYMDGEADPIIPDVAPRDDHATCILYAPGINWLSGEPAEGKSILGLWWVAQVLHTGGDALYLDYEGTEQGIVDRLRQMGVSDVTRLAYVRVSEKWDAARLGQLRELVKERQFRIAVIDAVAGAMEAEGLNPEDNADVEKWVALIPTIISVTGAAVVCVDHVTKSKETRGRWMIGAQRKMARADAAFTLDMRVKAGVGRTGYGRLIVAKDRYGALAPHMRGSTIAEVAIASEPGKESDTFALTVALAAPPESAGPDGVEWKPTYYMEQVSRRLEQQGPTTKTELRLLAQGKKGGRDVVDKAIEALLTMGAIKIAEAKGTAKPYESVFPYRKPAEAVPSFEERYEVDRDDEDDPFG